MGNELVRTIIAFAVVAIWMVAIGVSLFTRDYTVLGVITPVAMVIVGFLFGRKVANGIA